MNAITTTSAWTRRARFLLAGGVLVALAGTAALAQAHSGAWGGHRHHGGSADAAAGPGAMGAMGGMMAGPWGATMGGRHGERMLDAAGVSAEQRAQIRQLVESARADREAAREGGGALHEQMRQLFTQPNVDANAAEVLRQQQLARMDATSKRQLQLMLDVSRVLTPEQRAKLAELAAQRKGFMRRDRAPKPEK